MKSRAIIGWYPTVTIVQTIKAHSRVSNWSLDWPSVVNPLASTAQWWFKRRNDETWYWQRAVQDLRPRLSYIKRQTYMGTLAMMGATWKWPAATVCCKWSVHLVNQDSQGAIHKTQPDMWHQRDWDNQMWYMIDGTIISVHDGKCLDYHTGTTNVYMHECHDGSNQMLASSKKPGVLVSFFCPTGPRESWEIWATLGKWCANMCQLQFTHLQSACVCSSIHTTSTKIIENSL